MDAIDTSSALSTSSTRYLWLTRPRCLHKSTPFLQDNDLETLVNNSNLYAADKCHDDTLRDGVGLRGEKDVSIPVQGLQLAHLYIMD